MTITVSNEDCHLMIQPKGQGKLEAIPNSETEFTVKGVDAKLTFAVGPEGKAIEMRLWQGGNTMVAKRVN
ncbi:MAG TPA: hypothetical protein VEU96_29940 [Bryobacteraceae bacterium]|nr:hypothetical protein [Bryobacteraceae bacterium]